MEINATNLGSFLAILVSASVAIYTALANRKTATALAKLTKDLEASNRERDTLFTALHKERANAIREIYARLFAFSRYLSDFLNGITANPDDLNLAEVKDKGPTELNRITNYYQKNSIYFSVETCALIEKVLNDLRDQYWTTRKYIGKIRGSEIDKEFSEVSDRIRSSRHTSMIRLQDDFRQLLGVTAL